MDPANPRYFHWRGKTQVFVASSEHYGSVINPNFNFEVYLNTIAADGLNHTRLFMGDYIEDSKVFGILDNNLEPPPGTILTPWLRSNVPGASDGGNKFDLDRWNPIYFERLHSFMQAAEQRSIVVEVVLFFIGPAVAWDRAPMNQANNINNTPALKATQVPTLDNGGLLSRQKACVQKLVSELNRYDNIIFDLINEPWFSNQDHEGFTSDPPLATREWMRVAASWVRDQEESLGKRHVLTSDLTNRGIAIKPSDLTGVYADLDGFNVHYDSFGLSLVMNRNAQRVMCFNETGFQGTDDRGYLIDGWRYLLMGGALYDHLDYSFTVAKPDGTHKPEFKEGYTGGGSPALRKQLAALLAFMNELPLQHMAPDDGVVLDFAGGPSVPHHALSWPGKVYAIFYPGDGPLTTSVNVPKGRWIAEWIDIETANVEHRESLEVTRWATTLSPSQRRNGGRVLRLCAEGQAPCKQK